jgi:hypothetical protein
MSRQNKIHGQAGGRAVVKEFGTRHMRKIGTNGGLTTTERYGVNYLRLIGTLGAHAVNGHLSKTRKMLIERDIRKILSEN